MRNLHLSPSIVKKAVNSRLSALLAVSLAGAVFLLSVFGFSVYPSNKPVNKAASKQGCCGGNVPRRMIGAYYNTKGAWKSALVLNNKGPNPIVVTPILYSMEGEKFVGPLISIAGESAYELYLNQLAANAGPKFTEGSYEFTYTGRQLEMGAGLLIVDEEKGLIFDEQLTEPGVRFSSPRAEAVYAVPYKSAKAVLILTNTTEKPFSVSGNAGDQSIDVNLRAHQTRIIDLKESAKGAGAVSLTQTGGGNSALLATVHVSEPNKGFSIAVPFSDPLKAKTNQIQGAGLRLGKLDGAPLTPVIAVRNVSDTETSVSATIPLGRDGRVDKIVLPRLSLAPGEMKLFDASSVRRRKVDVGVTAGLEIEHKGAPGSVVVSAMSVTPSGDKVFPLLMRDPQSILSSTGGYAWFAEDEYATTVYIKNTSEKEQTFRLDIVYRQGIWGSDIKKLAPHETYAFDIKQIRDARVKGSEGNTIPPDAESGHVYWTIFGSNEKALIGRAETVDPTGGMASTYECQTCSCSAATSGFSTGYYSGKVEPIGQDNEEPGGTRDYRAMQQDVNCYGGPGSWFPAPASIQWSTGNPNIATVNAAGTVTAQDQPGTTSVVATWTAYNQQWNSNNEYCDQYQRTGDGIAYFQTNQPVPHHVRVISDVHADYQDSGTPAQNCVYVREITQQVVNRKNRNITSGSTEEAFANLSTNNCPSSAAPTPASCASLGPGSYQGVSAGQFRDSMTVRNPPCGSTTITPSSGCGFTLTPTWRMCSGTTINVWTYNGETKSNGVKVDGRAAAWNTGKQMCPTGVSCP